MCIVQNGIHIKTVLKEVVGVFFMAYVIVSLASSQKDNVLKGNCVFSTYYGVARGTFSGFATDAAAGL